MTFDLPGYDSLAGGNGLGIDLEERDYGVDRYGSLRGSWGDGNGNGSGGLYDEEIPLGDDALLDLYVPVFPLLLLFPGASPTSDQLWRFMIFDWYVTCCCRSGFK